MNRYTARISFYVNAETDEQFLEEAEKIRQEIEDKYDNQPTVVEILECGNIFEGIQPRYLEVSDFFDANGKLIREDEEEEEEDASKWWDE